MDWSCERVPIQFGFECDSASVLRRLSDNANGVLWAESGFVAGKTNYVIIYGEGCFNSKRQARRTLELYNKYRDQVHFVVVDLDQKRSPEQQRLVKEYYQGSIPHVLILDSNGKPLYNSAGEVDSKHISSIFEQSFSLAAGGTK